MPAAQARYIADHQRLKRFCTTCNRYLVINNCKHFVLVTLIESVQGFFFSFFFALNALFGGNLVSHGIDYLIIENQI